MATAKLSISVHSIRCVEETDEAGADEPYVLVFAADLSKTLAGFTAPVGAVERYGPWEDTDKGEAKSVVLEGSAAAVALKKTFPHWRFPMPFWGIGGTPSAISDPDDVVFLVQVMENDDATASDVRSLVNAQMVASLGGVVNSDMSRSDLVSHLRRAMRDAAEMARKTGIPNADDRVGGVKELRLTASDLSKAAGGSHQKTLEFTGDGGKYRVRFEMRKV